METAFFACATTHPFSLISSDGVQNTIQIRSPDPEISGFIKRLPVIPEDIVNGAKVMIAVLRSRGMIKEITFVDVLNELRLRPLSETETILCLNWWIFVAKQGDTSKRLEQRSQLLDALVVSITGPPKKIMKLSDARTFSNSRTDDAIIPADGPLPCTLLPTNITSSFDPDLLASVFPWKQLSIVDWLRHVTDWKVAVANAEFDVTRCARWAERVLSVLAQAWPFLEKNSPKRRYQDSKSDVLHPNINRLEGTRPGLLLQRKFVSRSSHRCDAIWNRYRGQFGVGVTITWCTQTRGIEVYPRQVCLIHLLSSTH
jgi:hypothetical protein